MWVPTRGTHVRQFVSDKCAWVIGVLSGLWANFGKWHDSGESPISLLGHGVPDQRHASLKLAIPIRIYACMYVLYVCTLSWGDKCQYTHDGTLQRLDDYRGNY